MEEKNTTITLVRLEAYFLKTLLEGGVKITDSKIQQDIYKNILNKLNK